MLQASSICRVRFRVFPTTEIPEPALLPVGDATAFPYFDNGTQHLLVQDPASDNGSLPAVA